MIRATVQGDCHSDACVFLSTIVNHLPNYEGGKLTRDPRKTSLEFSIGH